MNRGLSLQFFVLFCAALVLHAEPIESSLTLEDIGVLRPNRVAGADAQRDYYLPLPSRIFTAAASRVRVEVQPSPLLDPKSVLGIWINDRPVDTVRVGSKSGAPVVLEGAIPKGTRADDPSRNILKLTVKGRLIASGAGTDAGLERAAAWFDVQPSSTFVCAFDNASADWLSVGRLAITLRPQVEIVLPSNPSAAQSDLALKAASWIAQFAPRSEIHTTIGTPDADLAGADRFVIESAADAKAPLELTAAGADRIVHLRASSEADAGAILAALHAAALAPLPGSSVRATSAVAKNPASQEGALLGDLDADAMSVGKGIGDTACTFHFDLAKVSRRPADLQLHLSGTISPTQNAAPTLAVFLNDRLVTSAALTAGATHFDEQITLPAAQLRGDNAVTVMVTPAAGSQETYFWQLDPASALLAGQPASAPTPLGLLDAARRFADADAYQVWLASPEDLRVAIHAVTWLQRVNPARTLSPQLVSAFADDEPALLVGSLAKKPSAAISEIPVTASANGLSLVSRKDASTLTLSPAVGIGLWQLATLGKHTPAILLDAWGMDGAKALENVSAQMARSVWIESGDVVVGDGATPVLTFATREAALPAVEEVPKPLVAASAAPSQAALVSASVAAADWTRFRWWIIGGLWLALSAVIVWIFEQGRRRASP
jgi:hypothetical protein